LKWIAIFLAIANLDSFLFWTLTSGMDRDEENEFNAGFAREEIKCSWQFCWAEVK